MTILDYRSALAAVREAEFAAQEIGWKSLSPEIRCAAHRVAEAYGHAWAGAFTDHGSRECTREFWVMDATLAEIRDDILAAGPGPCGYGIAYPQIGPALEHRDTPAYRHVTGTGRTGIRLYTDPRTLRDVAMIEIRRPDGHMVSAFFDLERADYVPRRLPYVSADDVWHTRHAEAWQWAYRAIFPAAIEDMPFPVPVLPDEIEEAA